MYINIYWYILYSSRDSAERFATRILAWILLQGSLKFVSQLVMAYAHYPTFEDAAKKSAAEWTNGASHKQQWAVRTPLQYLGAP